jgi:sterol desaturase/sphingolipid hydroxylase (fatty acid hydroxylase superfamily)
MDLLDKILLFIALPTVVIASWIEALVLSRKQSYDWRAAGISLLDLVIRVGTRVLFPLTIAAPLVMLASQYQITRIDIRGWEAICLLFVGQEFFYYWYHRAAHRVRWFWANHSVHHSSNQLNLSAAYRIGILGQLSGTALFFVPLVLMGFPAKIVYQLLTLNLLYQFWIHVTWIPKLGWLEYVLNTPSAHRVHHAANLEYLDANYGGVLIVFDRLFGTYVAEREDLPCRYGWVEPLKSYNPLHIEFGRWVDLFRDVALAPNLRSAIGYIVMPPGWRADGQGETTEDLRRLAQTPPAATSAPELRQKTL